MSARPGSPVTIDGALGEGGGQVLRTSLGLSLVTGRPFRIVDVRSRRARPGLMRQHLTAVEAAAAVGGARVEGAWLGSTEVLFEPGPLRAGEHRFAIGTAGSTTLVLQALLPALLRAPGETRLVLEGGTHNAMSPPYDFLALTFLPLLRRMGARVEVTLERAGFHPAGGGRLTARVQPCPSLAPLELLERGAPTGHRARVLIAHLPTSIAQRELAVVERELGWRPRAGVVEEHPESAGPGNACLLELGFEQVTEVVASFGRRGRRAEAVAREAADAAREYLATDAPVGRHLADQLLVPLAVAGAGRFRTLAPTRHTRTNARIVQAFLDVTIDVAQESDRAWSVEVGSS